MQTDRHADRAAQRPGARPTTTPDPMTGRLLEKRYRIGARIARGGMASVYEATDLRLDRTVAIKVMHPGLGDDDEFAARFVHEARSAARLSHPNIVAVHDQGDDDGVVFLAMELVRGHTMRDAVSAHAPMSAARALAQLEPVVSALAAAHRAGLVHRDVKPENVLIADDGRVKVADFGLAKAVSAETQHTSTGVLIGTVSYIAPELVVEGRSDARVDVYAVGVMLYELLTGRKPHEGESPIQVAYKHVHQDVPPPSRAVAGIPSYVDALVARATARDRELRPADAAVLLRQLHRVAQALAEGVREDPELVTDLMPGSRRPKPEDLVGERPTDTSPEPWDADEMEALLRPTTQEREHTSTLAPPAHPPRTVERQRPPVANRTRRRRRVPVLLLAALLLAVAVGGGAWWFGYARYTTTPGVIGLTRAQATQRIDAMGLEMRVDDPAYSSTVQAGEIVSTQPGAGDRVVDGGTVSVTLSLGEEVYDIPALTGRTASRAREALAAIKMADGRTLRRFSEKVPAGEVIRTVPLAGATRRPGTTVDLVVSQGRRPIQVGSWVEKDADAAQRTLEERDLVVERGTTAYSDTVAEGHVISQSPVGGTLHRGETVNLVVSRGPELVEMPSVRAHGVDDATAELRDLGFEVRTERAGGYLGLGYVFSTDPAAGEMVAEGSPVTLYLI